MGTKSKCAIFAMAILINLWAGKDQGKTKLAEKVLNFAIQRLADWSVFSDNA
jgi:ferritin-like protein